MGIVEITEHIDALRRDGSMLADAAERAGLDADVPPCAPWRVKDLLRHTGYIHRWAARHIAECPDRVLDGPPEAEILRGGAADEELPAWFRAGHAALVETLRSADPGLECATFMDAPSPLAFWARRQAHEIAIHRCDADLANGNLGAIAADLAADGVNEYFELLLLMPAVQAITGTGETVHFHCTDREVEWVAELTPDGVALRPDHAKGDVAVRGSANALFLLVWNRIGPDNPELEVFGDRALLDRWLRLTGI